MSGAADLSERRRDRQRELLAAKDRWTPREALEAVLADIDAGDLDADGLVIFTIRGAAPDGVRVGRYVGAVGANRTVSGLELVGACFKALTDWSRGD